MKYNNISKGELREQAEGYVRAVQWNLHYYYHGCCSWSWCVFTELNQTIPLENCSVFPGIWFFFRFYPHHYAPYISDVTDFADMEMNFELNEPFHPFEQLLAVLPAASAECLPLPLQVIRLNFSPVVVGSDVHAWVSTCSDLMVWGITEKIVGSLFWPVLFALCYVMHSLFQELMRDPTSPIIDFYPEEFHTDLNGKKNDWEAVVLIPFIKEDRLLKAVATKEPLLNYEVGFDFLCFQIFVIYDKLKF